MTPSWRTTSTRSASPWSETAEALAEQLAAVGLTPGGGRQIDVLALSSGALVVRWFVERLGGAPLVRRAVLAGVPNEGAPWAAADGWATAMVAVGLNGLSSTVWPADVLGWVVGAMERLDRRIDAIAPGSDLLGELGAGDPSGAPYVVVTGSSSLSGAAEVDQDDGRLGRLLSRLGQAGPGSALFGQPNDLFVTAASAPGTARGPHADARPRRRGVRPPDLPAPTRRPRRHRRRVALIAPRRDRRDTRNGGVDRGVFRRTVGR